MGMLLWMVFPQMLWGMEGHAPEVRSFSKTQYGASSQNWSIAQGEDGTLYMANSAGLLEYDGSTWLVHSSPDRNILRAVAIGENGLVYTSGYQELGYWKRDGHGALRYTSLKEKAQALFTPNVEYWNIFIDGPRVLFQSFTQILVYEKDSFTSINFDYFVNAAALHDGKLFINEMDRGLFVLRGNEKIPLVEGDFFRGKAMRFLLPWDEGRYLMGTASDGIYVVSEGKAEEWSTPFQETLRRMRVNRACLLPGGEVAIGTILGGVYLLGRDGHLVWHLDTRNGMQNNTVLGLHTDSEGNLWAALDRGVDLIMAGRPAGVRLFPLEGIGAVYDAALFEGRLYLGTNQGLYAGEYTPVPGNFTLVPGTQGQVWDLEIIGRELVAGHNSGTFALTRGEVRMLSPVSGGFSIRPDPRRPGVWLQCTYSNLVEYRMENGRLRLGRVIYNFNELIRFLEFDHLGNLWAGHMYRGIYRLQLHPAGDSVRTIAYYGENSVFGREHHLRVFNLENRVVFTSGERLYTYDDLKNEVIPFDRLNTLLGEYAGAERIIPAGAHRYWLVTPHRIGLWQLGGGREELVREYPSGVFNNQLIRNYQNVSAMPGQVALVCLENGIALVDTRKDGVPRFPEGKTPVVREAWLNGRDGQPTMLTPDQQGFKIPWSLNSFHVRMAFPWFSNGPVSWEWFLDGLSPQWNPNGDSPLLALVRLPPGRYTLRIRAADNWGNHSHELQIPLTVRQPWFWSVPARIFYLLLSLTALFFFRLRVIANTRKSEERKREENERELISLKNDKLQAEISYKSRELANSTMAIIKKNEFLLDLRDLVLAQKNQLGTRYPDKYSNELLRRIDNHLSSHDEWKIFETHFEQAHETFMKNLKNRYPDLTPGDMRLCAFLRMNLASKEIAPLMGISVRGVENHRYRLRSKLGLEHDENLIGTLLKL